MTKYTLVGDADGTSARLALCDIASGGISQTKTYSEFDYLSLGVVIRVHPGEHKVEMKNGCIAVAYPIIGGWVTMTSHIQTFSTTEMKKNLGFSHLKIINDFTAILMAIPMLRKEHLTQFGGARPVGGKSIAIYDAGTGLGVTYLVHVDKRWVNLPGKGSHVNFAPNGEEEGVILEILHTEIGHVSAECVFFNPGLVNLYHAIAKADNRLPENSKSRGITERALAGSCTDCRHALSLFCVVMGRFGGNLVLSLGTFGGVFIADGIVPRFLEFFKASGFRVVPGDRGCFREHAHDIPMYLIVHDSPGFLGSGTYSRQALGHIL